VDEAYLASDWDHFHNCPYLVISSDVVVLEDEVDWARLTKINQTLYSLMSTMKKKKRRKEIRTDFDFLRISIVV
jgi:hypothetical protein